MIKLIVTDIDGTLINNAHRYSERLVRAVNAARAQNVLFTLATGRMYCSGVMFAKELQVDLPIICYNGGYIRDAADKVYYKEGIDPQSANTILKVCRGQSWHVQYCVNDNLFCAKDTDYMREYSQVAKVPYQVLGEEFYTAEDKVNKFLFIQDDVAVLRDIQQRIAEVCTTVDFTRSQANYLEVIPKGVNKGVAIKSLAQILNVDTKDIMAIGDSYNDLEMLTAVGHGVAMGQAPEDVKAAVAYVTDTNEQDGLAKAIEKYVLGI